MAGDRRRTALAATSANEVEEPALLKDTTGDLAIVIEEDEPSCRDSERIAHLRGRWELASVLNFLSVFEPVIGSDLRVTAEEIETGLVKPDTTLAKLHISLLKGIPPVSKSLNGSDAWISVLCKKLALWWPWVAEGGIPLTASKGEEIFRYKELDPADRLLILKALCEIRADQDDAVSYVNNALKKGTEISCFRKNKIGADRNANSYWCDGSTVMGYRLYREVKKPISKTNMAGKASSCIPLSSFQWETLATSFEEFRDVVDELSCSKVVAEVAVGKAIKTDVLPLIEKLHKKKEMALKRKQRQEKLLNDYKFNEVGITRSCRSRRPINYTFDEYDRVIDEAINITKKMKTFEEQRNERKHIKQGRIVSNGNSGGAADSKQDYSSGSDSDMAMDSKGRIINEDNSLGSENESDNLQDAGYDDDGADNDDDYDIRSDEENCKGCKSGSYEEDEDGFCGRNDAHNTFGIRWSLRLAGVTSHPDVETGSLGAKKRLRQRPIQNSALDTIVVSDSDGDELQENAANGTSGHEDLSHVSDSEEVSNG